MIIEPLRRGDGWRHVFLGDTGMGKTWAMRRLVELPGQVVFVHDDAKAQPEYPQVRYFRTTSEMLALPVEELKTFSAAAFRGDAYAGITCEVDEVAGLALDFARKFRFPVRLVVDETDRAMSDAGKKLESPNLRTCITTGRTMGLSVLAGTQTPQRLPDVLINGISSAGLFRSGPAALNYLDERLYFDREMLEVVPTLQEGEFVLHVPGRPWDRCIYKF